MTEGEFRPWKRRSVQATRQTASWRSGLMNIVRHDGALRSEAPAKIMPAHAGLSCLQRGLMNIKNDFTAKSNHEGHKGTQRTFVRFVSFVVKPFFSGLKNLIRHTPPALRPFDRLRGRATGGIPKEILSLARSETAVPDTSCPHPSLFTLCDASRLSPLASPLSPLASPLSPLPSPLSPLPSRLSPLPSRLSPLASRLSPLASPLSPLPLNPCDTARPFARPAPRPIQVPTALWQCLPAQAAVQPECRTRRKTVR